MERFAILWKVFFCMWVVSMYSCNENIFVDELKVSAKELQMKGDGDTSAITLSSSDWMIMSVEPDIDKSYTFEGNKYDECGKLLCHKVSFNQIWMKERGVLTYEDKYTSFSVARAQNNRLDIIVGENLRRNVFKFFVLLSNDYISIPVVVYQQPTSGYTYERITYSYLPDSYKKYTELVDTFTYVNQTKNVSSLAYPVYLDQYSLIAFSSKDQRAFLYLETQDSTVDIPKGVKNGELVYSEEKACFNYLVQKKSLPFASKSETLVLPIGSTRICKMLEYEEYAAEYTLYVRNKKTDEERCVNGIFYSKVPTGKYRFVLDYMSE